MASERRCLLAAGEHRGRLVDVVAGEQERRRGTCAQPRCSAQDPARPRTAHVLEHGARRRPASRAPGRSSRARSPCPGATSPVSGCSTPAEQPQQGRLAGAVEAEHDDPRAAVDGQVDVGEDLERAVRLRQPGRRVSGVLPHGAGSGTRSLATLSSRARSSSAGQQPLGPPGHAAAPPCALVALARILSACAAQRSRSALGSWPVRGIAAPLVGLALLQVRSSSRRCRRRARPTGWRPGSRPLFDHGVRAISTSVADQRRGRPCAPARYAAQPHDRVGVEVVGHGSSSSSVVGSAPSVGEQDAGQLRRARRWPPDKRAQRLVDHRSGRPRFAQMRRRLDSRPAYPPRRGEALLQACRSARTSASSSGRSASSTWAFSMSARQPVQARARTAPVAPRVTSRSPVRGSCGR